ncbi:uncharacterized protein [Antedon mediterranea]|uniref:uncharacterized protein n=1 Tax=Antedon mediterranea TaxID=105859 RepID=UPI003AF48E52
MIIILKLFFVLILTAPFAYCCNNTSANCPDGCDCDDGTVTCRTTANQTYIICSNLQELAEYNEQCQIQRLVLKSNKIHSLPENAFTGLASLEELDLSDNQIHILPDNVFDDLKALKTLNLSGNRVSKLEAQTLQPANLISNLTKSQTPDLSRNEMKTLSGNVFSGLNVLEEL